MRVLLRMERPLPLAPVRPVAGVTLRTHRAEDHTVIPEVFAAAFGKEPWPHDWDRFDEYDPVGVFLAVEHGAPIGFAICFRRRDHGYISVVAVVPPARRRGVASALVTRASEYLGSLGLQTVRIDAYEDSPPAVGTYRSLGFEVYATVEEDREP